MAFWLTAFIGVVYLAIAIDLFIKEDFGHSIAYLGYALGNVGLCMVVK